jgi:hypothetical protein
VNGEMRFCLALCIVASLGSSPAGAEEYSVPGLGAVILEAPKTWRVQQKPGPTSLYLQFVPESGNLFNLQVTSTWLQQGSRAALTSASVKERVEGMTKGLLPNATEKEAQLIELNGKEVAGYYFTITDRNPSPGPKQYKYLTQGMLSNSVGVTFFTLLHRESEIPERQQTLAMLAGASYSTNASAPTPLVQDSLRVAANPDRYELWVPASRVYMIVPRGRLTPADNPAGGAASSPRYFYFVDRAFNLSGWFEPADKFSGVQSFWETEMRAWSQRGLPAPLDVQFKKVGEWNAIIYDSPSPLGTNSHIRAHWVQEGTWIDVHLSMTSSASSAQLRSALEALLQALLVRTR